MFDLFWKAGEKVKTRWVLFSIILLLALILLSEAGAQDNYFRNPEYSQEFIEQQQDLLRNVEKTFPRIVLWETFDGTTKPISSKENDGSLFYEMNRAGKREMMLAAPGKMQEDSGWGESHFNTTGSYVNFYLSVDVQLIEMDPEENGYLWIQYTDGDIVGSDFRSAGEIDFPSSVRIYETGPNGRVYTTFYDLSEYRYDYDPHKIEMIRLDGFTSVFIDGRFIVRFEDGFSGRFYQLYGVGMKTGGTYTAGSFDNLIIRFQNY